MAARINGAALGGVVLAEVARPITIDGEVDDWDLDLAAAIERQPLGYPPPDSPNDLSVRASFAFDVDHLYLAVVATDDFIETRQRAWRYGDGFMLTVGSTAEGAATRRFVSFGFPYAQETPRPTLVNRDGRYFPAEEIADIRYAVRADPAAHRVVYEAAIPWPHLAPFSALAHRSWGVNLTYVDQDSTSADEARKRRRTGVQLIADQDYESEQTHWRRIRAVRVVPLVAGEVRCQADFSRRAVLLGDALDVAVGCVLGEGASRYQLRATLLDGEREVAASTVGPAELGPGWHVIRPSLTIPALATGTYRLRLHLKQGDQEVFEATRELVIAGVDLLELFGELDELQAGRASHPLVPSLEIRLEWIRSYLREAGPATSPKPLMRWIEEARELAGLLRASDSSWKQDEGVFRFAHRSRLDGRLQPYSVYVPKGYNRDRPPPLTVVLHGSGVDEQRTIASAGRRFRDTGWLVIAPLGRGLSDFYLGPSGEDVIEAMDHLQTLLPYDQSRVTLQGFSMGGFGAWRLSLLYPDRFVRVAVLSGCVRPREGEGNAVIDLLARTEAKTLQKLSYLVVHGARDRAVEVTSVRELLGRLRELGVAHDYVELPDAAHGDYDVNARLIEWLARK